MQGEGNAASPYWWGFSQPAFNNRHLWHSGAAQEDRDFHPQCHGSFLPPAQASPVPRAEPAPALLADLTPTSRLPAAGIINTSRLSAARPGCSPAPQRHVQGRQIGRLLEEANLTGWRAARPPWPPATAPASRRASLPDTSLRRVTGHWVVSR